MLRQDYYASYMYGPLGSTGHAFVAISKKTKRGYVLLGSWGLYNDGEANELRACQINYLGRVLSDNKFIQPKNPSQDLGIVSFPIERERLYSYLKRLFPEIKVTEPEIKEVTKVEVKAEDKAEDKAKENSSLDTDASELSPMDRAIQQHFQTRLTNVKPPLNFFDLNCHKYAVYTLSQLGIRDGQLEQRWSPCPPNGYVQPCRVSLGNELFTPKQINIKKPTKLITFPETYYFIWDRYENRVDAAIALLKDYSDPTLLNRLFHCGRHFTGKIRNCIKHIEENNSQFTDLKSIIKYISSQLPFRNMTGSLQRRLDFLSVQAQYSEEKNSRLKLKRNHFSNPDKRVLFRH